MNIVIDDKYRITGRKLDYVLHEIKEYEEDSKTIDKETGELKYKKGDKHDEWLGYYSKFEHIANAILEKELIEDTSEDLKILIDVFNNRACELYNNIKEVTNGVK